MRRIVRPALPNATQQALDVKQADADAQRLAGTLDINVTWRNARQTALLRSVLIELQNMAGVRQRCMYCHDSHGTDIEHFWPKTPYPGRMFQWPNLLLNCTECGRFKGDDMPLDANGAPMLVDPTSDDPWTYLDYHPLTGNIVARFNTASNAWEPKGETTVTRLHLDAREGLAAANRRTYKRILKVIDGAISAANVNPQTLVSDLSHEDDHGLLGWCFGGTGQNESQLAQLRQMHPQAWSACVAAFV